MDVTCDLINSHQKVQVFTDTTHVNKFTLLHSMSEGIRLIVPSHMTSSSKTALKDAVNSIVKVRKNAGFNVKHIDADVKSERMQEELKGAEVGIVDADNHVEEVERDERESKESVRGLT